jgi:hypothetical protein
MAQATRKRTRLSDKELLNALELIKDSDSVELKLSVTEHEQRSAVRALGMDPLDAQIRQVFFFDTAELALNKVGLVVRARRVQGKGDDSVVKLRPVVPSTLAPELRKSPNFGVEVDAMPGGYVCSASMKNALAPGTVKPAIEAGSLKKMFSKEQRRFYAKHSNGIEFEDLAILGPIFVLKLKFRPVGFAGKLVAELWFYPDDRRILELSTKCPPDKALETALATRSFLSDHGIDLEGEQQTKTKTALDFFTQVEAAAV